MALLLHPGPVPLQPLKNALQSALGTQALSVELRVWPDIGDAQDIRWALVSRIPAGELARLPALQLMGSLHAGIDHLLTDAALPAQVPLTRPVPVGGDTLMNEFILAQVLRHHRDMPAYAQAQQRQQWLRLDLMPVAERRVGFLGLGAMGLPAAQFLARVGFDVAGWVRSPRPPSGMPVFHGEGGLQKLLARSQILVNLLPLTKATDNIVNAKLLAALPRGAALINVGRGQHVVEADLLGALDSGQLAAATLDVFRTEPLPASDPLWHHPAITITPHTSRRVAVDEVVAQFVANMVRLAQGLKPLHTVDRSAGY